MKKVVVSILLSAGLWFTAQAASDSWKLDADGSWTNPASWTGGNVPGTTNGTTSTDVATFGTVALTAHRLVSVDANRNIAGITFDNANRTAGYQYKLTNGTIRLSNGGVIQTAAGNGVNTNGGGGDTIISAIEILGDGGTATFSANAANNSSGISFAKGAVTGVSTAGKTTTLTLNGANTAATIGGANNQVTGVVGDGGGGGKLAIVKDGAGVWTVTGNNTFTGNFTLNSGTLRTFGQANAFGKGILVINGGAINMANGTSVIYSNAITMGGDLSINPNGGANGFSGSVDLGGANRTVTLSGGAGTWNISGVVSNGGLTKAGANLMLLSASNTYALGTTISAGTLVGDADGSFGTNSVTVANSATLTLTNGVLNNYIGNQAQLILGSTSTLNLGFIGTDIVGGLSLDGGTTWLPNGIYTAAQLEALPGATVAGTGSLTVGAKILRLISITSP
jgi:autotransporter-associated beta strand protein